MRQERFLYDNVCISGQSMEDKEKCVPGWNEFHGSEIARKISASLADSRQPGKMQSRPETPIW